MLFIGTPGSFVHLNEVSVISHVHKHVLSQLYHCLALFNETGYFKSFSPSVIHNFNPTEKQGHLILTLLCSWFLSSFIYQGLQARVSTFESTGMCLKVTFCIIIIIIIILILS
jgi:hypothetical protein